MEMKVEFRIGTKSGIESLCFLKVDIRECLLNGRKQEIKLEKEIKGCCGHCNLERREKQVLSVGGVENNKGGVSTQISEIFMIGQQIPDCIIYKSNGYDYMVILNLKILAVSQ